MNTGHLAINQIVLYINIVTGLVEAFAVLSWQVYSAQLQHEDDPNVCASLERKRKNMIIASILGVSIFSIINTIAFALGFRY